MKHLLLYAAILASVMLAACGGTKLPRQVDMPYCDGNLSCMVELTGVTRTDSNTVLTFLATNAPGWYELKITKDAYLTTGNNHLPIIGAEGIEPGSTLYLQPGVPTEFKLTFPPLPKSAKSLDFVDPWQSQHRICIWGVDLTGTRSANDVPAEIPEELLTNDLSGRFPKELLDTGTATVNIHIVAYRPWISPEGMVLVNHLNGKQQQLKFTADKNGDAQVKLRLAGASGVTVMTGSNVWSATLIEPGETVNFYAMPTNSSESQRGHRLNAYSDGKFRMEPLLETRTSVLLIQTIINLEGELLYQCTDRDRYFANTLELDRRLRDSIAALDVEPMLREWMTALADRQLLRHIGDPGRYILGDWNDGPYTGPEVKFSPEQIAEVMKRVDFDSPLMMAVGKNGFDDRTAWPAGSIPANLATLRRISRRAVEGNGLTDADADTLRSLGDPFYLKAAKMLDEVCRDPASGRMAG